MNRLFSLASLTTLFWVAGLASASAQLVPDNTLGSESSTVTPNVNIRNINSDRIDGGAVRGNNLFHSFQEFNVEAGRGVYFSNPETIINILTRVTGDNISNILGTLGVLGNANLFLINPNGIVFGPNARLDVGGSFFASTADSILFENGIEFAASNPQAPPLLTINIPIGLNLRNNPGNITVQGEGNNFTSDPNQPANLIPSEQIEGLQVPPGQT
ncbi:MAG: filamentous hemagglutinin N-terminal domain-containing protein, partial [Cyanobacteriota bacterium]|nr:filamentous hemagglutinin N-terminal domain-containing protein [Cyanobacteriota bacterium]